MPSRHLSFENFMKAVRCGDLNVVESYIDANRHRVGKLNRQLEDCTPLMLAAFKGHLPIVQRLLAVPSSNVNITNLFGDTALSIATRYGRGAIVNALLAIPDVRIHTLDNDGYTPLMNAVEHGSITIVEALIERLTTDELLHRCKEGDACKQALARGQYFIAKLIKARIKEQPSLLTFQQRLENIRFPHDKIPEKFRCPISYSVMNDPIGVSSGQIYDRSSLKAYFDYKSESLHLQYPINNLQCPINKSSHIQISELHNLTLWYVKCDIENFVQEQEKLANVLIPTVSNQRATLFSTVKNASTQVGKSYSSFRHVDPCLKFW